MKILRFYQIFWDTVRDIQPIKEVTRKYTPTEHIIERPKHRPTSLILPIQLGIVNTQFPSKHHSIRKGDTSSKPQTEYSSDEESTDSQRSDDSKSENHQSSATEKSPLPNDRIIRDSPNLSPDESEEDNFQTPTKPDDEDVNNYIELGARPRVRSQSIRRHSLTETLLCCG